MRRTRGSMRRSLIIMACVLTLCTAQAFASYSISRLSDLRSLALGSAGTALQDSPGSFPRNPATLHRRNDPLFRVGGRYGETIKGNTSADDPVPWIQMPTAAFEMLFSNRFIGLSIGLGNVLQDRRIAGDELRFTAFNDSRIQLTAAYGWEHISFGLFAQGGNQTQRDVVVRKGSAITDYITRTYLERYDQQSDDGQFFMSGLGMLLSYQWVSIGLMTDSLFRMDYDTNELVLDIADMFRGTSVGLGLSTPVFDRNNELNTVVLNGVFDVTDLGSPEHRSVRFGLEGKIQFLGTLWLALRSGYQEIRPTGSALFAIEGSGTLTFGIGSRIENLGIDLAIELPLLERTVVVSAGMTWGM